MCTNAQAMGARDVEYASNRKKFYRIARYSRFGAELMLIHEATEALKSSTGTGLSNSPQEIVEANRELLTLHELISHRLVQILIGSHRGRKFFGAS